MPTSRTASKTSAQSSAERASGPSLSRLHASAIAPRVGTRPNVGRWPVTPLRVDGETMEPYVSLPIAKGTSPAETAAAGPALDPLDPCSTFHGLFVRPPNHTSPHARAPSESLATSTAPEASRSSTTAASPSRTWFLYGIAPHVVRAPSAWRRSLAPYGMPWSGPRSRPLARSASRSRAVRSARSSVSEMTASSCGSRRRSRSSASCVSSTEETRRARSSAASSGIDAKARSRSAGVCSTRAGMRTTMPPRAAGGAGRSSARMGATPFAGSCSRIVA